MSLPAIERLRHEFPRAFIAIVVPAKLADFWRGTSVDTVIAVQPGDAPWRVAQQLRPHRFSVGIAFPDSLRAAVELALAEIPHRVGYGRLDRSLLLSRRVSRPVGVEQMQKRTIGDVMRVNQAHRAGTLLPKARVSHLSHHIYKYLGLVTSDEAAGIHSTSLQAPRMAAADTDVSACLERLGLAPHSADSPLFAMCPGAEYGPAKRWPEERFIKAGRELTDRLGCRWVLFGSLKERHICARITYGLNLNGNRHIASNLAGETSLKELVLVLRACALAVTNDTGPMHIAAAVGTTVIGIFGSTSPEFTGPGMPGNTQHRILRFSAPCSPCFLKVCPIDMRCMDSVTVESVVQQAIELHGQAEMELLAAHR